jgi:peptidyl-tRNA hydrolase, PTH2 family
MSVKQVIIIRKDLKMRRGKECAQASHASGMWMAERLWAFWTENKSITLSRVEEEWVRGYFFKKVVLQVSSEEELVRIYDQAKQAGIVAHLIIDHGLTEFAGVPTKTAVAIGPDDDQKIDPITGGLQLY